MLCLRPFTNSDVNLICEKLTPAVSVEEAAAMIGEWRTNTFQGRYFEMLAITVDGAIVGSISLYGRSVKIASIGVEVLPEGMGKGYASESMRLMIEKSRVQGYTIIMDQVRADNRTSISLHEKLGFETDGYVYKNAKDQNVLIYLLRL